MKKLLSLTAATFVILALAGCSQDGVVNEAPSVNQAIEFGTYLGRDAQGQTRVAAATTETVKADGFGVYAYYTQNKNFDSTTDTDPNFMNNQAVTWPKTAEGAVAAEGAWTYTPLKYWPNNTGDKVTFLAYTPYNIDGTATSNFSINFEVKPATAEQKDLLYAEALLNETKHSLNTPVTFNFKHALARIGFTVQGAIDATTPGGTIGTGTTITVNKVMLSGKEHTYSEGTATVSNTPAFHKTGVLNILTGDWTTEENTTDKLLFTLLPANFVGNTNVTLSGAQTDATELTNDDSYLMIIPQDFTNTDMYVYVEYTVTTTDTSLTDDKSEITNYISTKAPINFEKGKAYTINLVLGMNSVDLSASVAGWGDEKKQVDLPANTNN